MIPLLFGDVLCVYLIIGLSSYAKGDFVRRIRGRLLLLIIICILCSEKPGNRDYELALDCVTLDDDAEYMFVARNVHGEVRSKAQLLVETAEKCTCSMAVLCPSVLVRLMLEMSDHIVLCWRGVVEAVQRSAAQVQLSVSKSRSSDDLHPHYPDTDDLLKVAVASPRELESPRASTSKGKPTNTKQVRKDEINSAPNHFFQMWAARVAVNICV